jgi:ubiquinone/menaquinone biosynthesis methyltransferase
MPGDRVLDLACGTGDLALAAAPRVRRSVGLDVTERMLQIARQRAGRLAPSTTRSRPSPARVPTGTVHFLAGDMLALPFAARSFDVVTTGYGLRNVVDLPEALREIRRVLVPEGRFLSLDFNRPARRPVRAVYLAYLTVVGSALGYALHRDPDTYRYIPESIRNYPGAEGVSRLIVSAGFGEVRCVPLLGGLMSLHLARRR